MGTITYTPEVTSVADGWVRDIEAGIPDLQVWNQQGDNKASRLEIDLKLTRLPRATPPAYRRFIHVANGNVDSPAFGLWDEMIGRITLWDIDEVLEHRLTDDINVSDIMGRTHIAIGLCGDDPIMLAATGDDDDCKIGVVSENRWKVVHRNWAAFMSAITVRYNRDDVGAIAMEAAGDRLDSIVNVFDHYSKMVVDRRWLKQLLDMQQAFETRSEEHINFLGSNLIGVYIPTWLESDSEEWIDNILRIADWEGVTEAYHDLPDVNPSFEVAGRPINASYTYALYRIHTSSLSDREKQLGLMSVAKLLYYFHLGSVLHNWFRYRAQESIALSVYESLSRKSGLKKYGSWGALIENMAKNLTSSDGIHYKTFRTCRPDDRVIYSVTSVKTQVNQLVKELGLVYHDMRERDNKILQDTRYFTDADGEMELRDSINDLKTMETAVLRALADPMDFIRDELVDYTLRAVTTADERHLIECLEHMVSHRNDKRGGNITSAIEHMVRYIHQVRRTEGPEAAGVVSLTVRVRNLFRSSQLTNPDMLAIREELTELVEEVLSRRPDNVKASTRIACAVYILLRALAYQRY